jgi:hypothetical protein
MSFVSSLFVSSLKLPQSLDIFQSSNKLPGSNPSHLVVEPRSQYVSLDACSLSPANFACRLGSADSTGYRSDGSRCRDFVPSSRPGSYSFGGFSLYCGSAFLKDEISCPLSFGSLGKGVLLSFFGSHMSRVGGGRMKRTHSGIVRFDLSSVRIEMRVSDPSRSWRHRSFDS